MKVRYPAWRREKPEHAPTFPAWREWVSRRVDTGGALGTFDAVFICRSGAWVPTWCDAAFWSMLDAMPTGHKVVGMDRLERRPWDIGRRRWRTPRGKSCAGLDAGASMMR